MDHPDETALHGIQKAGFEAFLVEAVVHEHGRVGYCQHLCPQRDEQGERQVSVPDRPAERALPLSLRHVDVNPLMVVSGIGEGISPGPGSRRPSRSCLARCPCDQAVRRESRWWSLATPPAWETAARWAAAISRSGRPRQRRSRRHSNRLLRRIRSRSRPGGSTATAGRPQSRRPDQ